MPNDAQDTPDCRIAGLPAWRSAALAASLLWSCAVSCASPGPKTATWTAERTQLAEQLEASLAATAEATLDGSLLVRLAFGPGADLDLFVTDLDPRVSETVYFAKHQTRAGGHLLRDARCGDGSPRSDAVLYDAPHAAGYRIGVDYHRSCEDPADFAVFVVEWMSGEQRQIRRGIARPGHFDDRFWMLEAGVFLRSEDPSDDESQK